MKILKENGEESKVLLVDALNLYLRSFTVDPTLNRNGNPIGGLRGFFRSLQKNVRDLDMDYCIVVWDGPGGSEKRRRRVSSYKSNRRPVKMNSNVLELSDEEQQRNKVWQQTRIHEYLNITPVPQFIFDGIEADDVIAYLANEIENETIILSNDKDFLQLCADKVKVYTPIRKVLYDRDKVIEEYDCLPENFVIGRAIAGDQSDNLPGVPRVGLKTVMKLFPQMKENPEYYLSDLIKECKTVKSKLKSYQSILSSEKLIKTNYSVMQLYSPSISPRVKENIKEGLFAEKQQYKKIMFDSERFKDGFSDNLMGIDTLFKKMKKSEIK